MTSLNTRAALALATLLAAAAPAIAFAGEGNGDPFGIDATQQPVTANPIETQTGSSRYQGFDRRVVVGVVEGAVTRPMNNQSEPEPLNSLPSAPAAGG